eukprot:scaffold2495_cov101-Isochrysis_galbana.AAC.3
MLGHFLTGTAAPCALSHRPAMAAAASRHHRCSGHLPGTREDSRGKGGGRAVPLHGAQRVRPPAPVTALATTVSLARQSSPRNAVVTG